MLRDLQSIPIETNLVRKGLVRIGRATRPVDSRDLLGVVRASTALRLADLDVLGWLSSRLLRGETHVAFSREELVEDLFGRKPGGRERALVLESLERLKGIRLTLGGYDAADKTTDLDSAFVDVSILMALERLPATSYAMPTWRVELDEWLLRQLAHGYATYFDWGVLRTLRGLQKRLWLYFEAEPRDAFWVSLSHRGLTTLSVADRTTGAARKALLSASRGLKYNVYIRPTRVGDRLFVTRNSASASEALFGDDLPTRRSWVRIERRARRPVRSFDPTASLVGSLAPSDFGARRNEREGMGRPSKQTRPRILRQGRFPDDQIDLLLWLREDARGLDQILVLVDDARGSLTAIHNPGCPDLTDALEDSELTGIFVAAEAPQPIDTWCAQREIGKPRWCTTCRARFYERADTP